jgi:hypothetical protein
MCAARPPLLLELERAERGGCASPTDRVRQRRARVDRLSAARRVCSYIASISTRLHQAHILTTARPRSPPQLASLPIGVHRLPRPFVELRVERLHLACHPSLGARARSARSGSRPSRESDGGRRAPQTVRRAVSEPPIVAPSTSARAPCRAASRGRLWRAREELLGLHAGADVEQGRPALRAQSMAFQGALSRCAVM